MRRKTSLGRAGGTQTTITLATGAVPTRSDKGKHASEESGASLVETALVLPVFLFFTFVFINFSLVMFGLCNVTYASRLALRYASLHSSLSYTPTTPTAIQNLVRPFVFQYPSNTEATVVNYGVGGNTVGQSFTVTTTLQYNLNLLGFVYTPSFSFIDQGMVIQ